MVQRCRDSDRLFLISRTLAVALQSGAIRVMKESVQRGAIYLNTGEHVMPTRQSEFYKAGTILVSFILV